MIDPNWTVIDLDPRTWRNLGPFIGVAQYIRTAQPGEHALYVLHDNGRPLNVYDSQHGATPHLISGPIENPQLLAHDLYETGQWDRVHVINKQHLIEVARQSQTIENRDLTFDAYYRKVFELIWKNPQGYVSLPPHPGDWHGWTYSGLQTFVRHLPSPATVALGVLENDSLYIGLILEIREGLIQTVTTFEALNLSGPLSLAESALDLLAHAINAKFSPLAAALVCNRETFESWIAATDKGAVLTEARKQRKAFWRLKMSSGS